MRSLTPFLRLAFFASLFSVSSVYAQDNITLKNGTEIQAKVLEISPGQIKYRRQDNPDGPIYTTGTADILLIKYANGTKDILGQSATSTPGMSPAPLAPTVSGLSNSAGTAVSRSKLGYHHGLFSRYFTDGAGERIDLSVARSLMVNNPGAMQAFRYGQSLRRWSYITAGSAVALIGAGAVVALAGHDGFGRDGNNRRDGMNTTTEPGNGSDYRGDHGGSGVGIALAGGGVVLGVASLLLNHRATVQFRRAANRYNQQPTSLHVGSSQRGMGVGLAYRF